MKLEIGKQYKKSDLGIVGPERQWSEITVEGELVTFFSDDTKYKNIPENDGFVYEGRGLYQGFSMKAKYSKVMLWWKGYYLNK